MKVLLVTTHLNMGGIGVYTANLARYLKKNDIEVIVASSGGDLAGLLSENNVKHIKLDLKTKAEFGIKVWKAIPKLLRIVRENKIDIMHAQTRVSQALSCIVSKLSGVPYVTTCHGFFKHQRFGRRLFPCWGNKTIAISKSVEKHLTDDFNVDKKNVSMIYNGIEISRYLEPVEKDDDLRKKLNISDDKIIVGTVGRLSPVKGYKYLINAFKEVADKNKDVSLLLVGEGPEKENLLNQINDLALSSNVIMVPGSDGGIEKYFGIIDIFCLPSIEEGLGLSLMEAMASGSGCIATRVGGLKELIDDGDNGLLVPSQDYKALSAAILKLIEDKSLREKLSSNARKKALNSFSIEDSVKKTITVYREAIGGR